MPRLSAQEVQEMKGRRYPFMKKIVKASKKAIAIAGFFSIFINLLTLAVPIYLLQLFDRVLPSRTGSTLFYMTLMVLAAILIFSLLSVVRARIMAHLGEWFDKQLSDEALKRSFDRALQGEPYNVQSLNDVAKVSQFLHSPALMAVFDAPWVPIFLIVIFYFHPLLGVIATVGAGVLLVLGILNEMATREPLQQAALQRAKNFQYVGAAMRNPEAIQGMGMGENLVSRWNALSSQAHEQQKEASRRGSTYLSLVKFARMTLQVAILGTGAYLAMQDIITAGTMIAASIIMSRALQPVEQAVGAWVQFTQARQSLSRLEAYFAAPQERREGLKLPEPRGELLVEELFYAFPSHEHFTLQNISFGTLPGEMTAVIGPSGAGKSTLFRVLVGALKPSRGNVRLDGADVYHWDRTDFGKHVGYVPQTVELFSGTVHENIARLGEVSSDAVIEAAKDAGAHEMILRLPEGYETDVGVNGSALSAGQAQRIALARALLGKPKLLVLDEPNSNLDTEGESALIQAITAARSRGCNVLIISHRTDLIRVVDKILYLKDGRPLLFGPRDQVLAKLQELSQASRGKPAETKQPVLKDEPKKES